jgi:hypothetical protein
MVLISLSCRVAKIDGVLVSTNEKSLAKTLSPQIYPLLYEGWVLWRLNPSTLHKGKQECVIHSKESNTDFLVRSVGTKTLTGILNIKDENLSSVKCSVHQRSSYKLQKNGVSLPRKPQEKLLPTHKTTVRALTSPPRVKRKIFRKEAPEEKRLPALKPTVRLLTPPPRVKKKKPLRRPDWVEEPPPLLSNSPQIDVRQNEEESEGEMEFRKLLNFPSESPRLDEFLELERTAETMQSSAKEVSEAFRSESEHNVDDRARRNPARNGETDAGPDNSLDIFPEIPPSMASLIERSGRLLAIDGDPPVEQQPKLEAAERAADTEIAGLDDIVAVGFARPAVGEEEEDQDERPRAIPPAPKKVRDRASPAEQQPKVEKVAERPGHETADTEIAGLDDIVPVAFARPEVEEE